MMRRLITTVVALLLAGAAHAGQVSHPVQGPPTTVLNHFACWNNITGSLLKDCTGGGGGGASSAGPINDIQTSDGAGGFLSFTPGAGVAAFLTVPSSANLLSGLTTKTGTGLVVFGTSPSLVTPTIAGATLSGTFAGTPIFSGVPSYTGLSALTLTKCLGLDAGNNLGYSVGACGAGGGGSGTVTNPGNLTTHAPLIGGANGTTDAKAIAALTNGQLAIGSTGADPVPAAITAGTGMGVTNGAGSITLNAKGVGVTGGQSPLGMGDNATALAAGSYYYYTNAAYTAPRSKNLPDSALQGVNDIEAVDVQQTLTSTNTLSLCAAGTDTLNGTTNGCVKISVAGGGVGLHNDGAGKWTTNWLGNVPVGTAAGQLLIWDNTKKIYTPAVLVQGANMTITNADGSITLAATGGGSGAITLVSTLTASNSSPDLAWTGLTANDYQLVCRNLTTSANNDVTVIQFGTGGTPTWNTTAANYSTTTTFTSGAGAVSGSVTSGTFTGLMPAGQTNTGTIGSWLNANLVSLTSGSEKEANGTSAYSDNSYHTFVGHTVFTTTVTAIRVHDETGGNLKTGTCSLYARST